MIGIHGYPKGFTPKDIVNREREGLKEFAGEMEAKVKRLQRELSSATKNLAFAKGALVGLDEWMEANP